MKNVYRNAEYQYHSHKIIDTARVGAIAEIP
jgi:hypothetical protein